MAIESISGKLIGGVLPSKSAAKDIGDAKQKTSTAVVDDTVNLTKVTQDIKTAVAGVTAPVVNEERVSTIKTALQTGDYKVDAERVSEKMLQFENKLPDST